MKIAYRTGRDTAQCRRAGAHALCTLLLANLMLVVVANGQGVPGGGVPTFPDRVYQPRLHDLGVDGGANPRFGRGELTPDGKLLVAYRRLMDGTRLRPALTVSVVRPERLQTLQGHLSAFYEPHTDPFTTPFGSDFAFGQAPDVNPQATAEWAFVHWGFEVVDYAAGGPYPEMMTLADGTPSGKMIDADYPISDQSGYSQMTLALRPLGHENPYPCKQNGVYDTAGGYTRYELWLVRLHLRGFIDYLLYDAGSTGTGQLVTVDYCPVPDCPPNPGIPSDPIFVGQNLSIIVKNDDPNDISATIDPFVELETGVEPNVWPIKGIEPTLTADGKLMLYHGNAGKLIPGGNGEQEFLPGHGNVTYVYNKTGCSADDWTAPRSITSPLSSSEHDFFDWAEFQRHYRVFEHPIKMPAGGDPSGTHTNEKTFLAGETVRGTYPWVSKDGSFFTAACAGASETDGLNRTRVGNYACGDITGGYIKHIDDVGVNPTRLGGKMDWPTYAQGNFSWRTFSFSTGLKPGMWEPLLGQNAPLPTQVASQRIPVLPMFIPNIDSYGEVRFEEADGHYLLYLACNESLDPTPSLGELNTEYMLDSTPDTSGRSPRARTWFNNGASFPQALFTESKFLRQEIGEALEAAGELSFDRPFKRAHENIGFKGQAILFNAGGRIDVRGADGLGGLGQFTIQAFVKALKPISPTSSLEFEIVEFGSVDSFGVRTPIAKLSLHAAGKFIGEVELDTPGGPTTLSVESDLGAIDGAQDAWLPSAGWRHVALTYDGSTAAQTRLRISLDGAPNQTASLSETSTVQVPAETDYYSVGPGSGTGNPVTIGNMRFAIDEVAVSDIVRNEEELRRDAYVTPLASDIVAWPAQAPVLPEGLEEDEAFWPAGVAWDEDVAELGEALFESEMLSAMDGDHTEPGTTSCATCHIPAEAFADEDQQFPLDVDGNPIQRFNTPTLLNGVFVRHKTFEGKALSFESQVVLPLTSGNEMGVQTFEQVVQRIQNHMDAGDLRQKFTDASMSITEENLASALAMYMRTLNDGGSAFDYQAIADANQGVGVFGKPLMTHEQKVGRALFFGKARCFSCHRGSAFTDGDFHNIQSVNANAVDPIEGRKSVTGRITELGALKTPSLRDVAKTKPYFHDGSKAELINVIEHYNDPFDISFSPTGLPDRHLRPLGLNTSEMDALVAFLESLTGTEGF